jgi:two-component system cell cycle sensor histidine kinase/response regulator CckA
VKLTRASEDSPEVSAAGATILVVDDERFVREFATSSLRTRGYQVVNAADGEEALVHLREMGSSVSAIFLDLTMPGLSGYELLWTIREMGVSSPVVLTSGYAEEEVLEKLHETSGVSFLQKPYTHDALLEAIDEAVATWNASRPARTNPPDAS